MHALRLRTTLVAFLVAAVTIPTTLVADTHPTFRLDGATDTVLLLAGAGMTLGARALDAHIGDPTPFHHRINALDRRFSVTERRTVPASISTALAVASLAAPALSLTTGLVSTNRSVSSTTATYGVMYTEAFLLATGIKELLKDGCGRFRPFTYDDDFSVSSMEVNDYTDSFPSGHTVYAFSWEHPFSQQRWWLTNLPGFCELPLPSPRTPRPAPRRCYG